MEYRMDFSFSSQIGAFFLKGLEDVVGLDNLAEILKSAPIQRTEHNEPFASPYQQMGYDAIAAIQFALEEKFGEKGGQGAAVRAGRSAFKYLLGEFGEKMGLSHLNFRLLPIPSRMLSGLNSIAKQMGIFGDEPVTVEQDLKSFFWVTQNCPFCFKRISAQPVCQFTVGLLQEFTSWASGGRIYYVRESDCRAVGSTVCRIRIDKKALD